MSGAIVIDVDADASGFASGVKNNVVAPLQDAQKVMTQIQDDKSGTGLQTSMEAAQTATARETTALQEVRDNLQTVRQASSSAAHGVQQDQEDNTSSFEVSTREQKSLSKEAVTEVNKNSKDMAANFAQGALGMVGSFTDVTNVLETGLQQVAFLGLEIPGLAVGAGIAALGVGLIQNALGNTQQSTQALQQAVADLTGQFDTLGVTGADAASQVNKQLDKMAQDGTLGKIAEGASAAKIPFKELADAIGSNNVPVMEKYKQQIDAAVISETKHAASLYNATGAQSAAYNADVKRLNALTGLQGELGDSITKVKASTDANSGYAQAAEKSTVATKAQSEALANVKAASASFASSVQSSYSSAAAASSDWAAGSKVDLGIILASTTEALQQAARLPNDITKLSEEGLSAAGAAYIKSLPNGEQIIDQLANSATVAQASGLIANFNAIGIAAGDAVQKGASAAKPAVPVSQSLDPVSAQKMLDTLKAQKANVNVVPVLNEAAVKAMQEELGKKAEIPVTPSLNPDAVAKMNATLKEQVKPEVAPVLNTDAVHAMKTQLAQNTNVPVIPSLDEGSVAKMRATLTKETKPQVAPVLDESAVQKMTEALGKQQKVPVIPDLKQSLVDQMHENIAEKQIVPVVPGLNASEVAAMRRTLTAQQTLNLTIDQRAIQRQLNSLVLTANISVTPKVRVP